MGHFYVAEKCENVTFSNKSGGSGVNEKPKAEIRWYVESMTIIACYKYSPIIYLLNN
jgi:hypothetical protein